MKRWSRKLRLHVENIAIDSYIAEIIEVSRRYGLSLSHEDEHGSFVVQKESAFNFNWLRQATDDTDMTPEVKVETAVPARM